MVRKSILILMASVLICECISAQDVNPGASIYFRTGISEYEPGFDDNAATLEEFIREVNRQASRINAVIVETSASPDGSYEFNEQLAMQRAKNLRRVLLDRLPLNVSQVKAYSRGIDWDMLVQLVSESACPWRDSVLSVISLCDVRGSLSAQNNKRCCRMLQEMYDGRAWSWMKTEVFARMRSGLGAIRCEMVQVSSKDTVYVINQTVSAPVISPEPADTVSVQDMPEEKPIRLYKNDSLLRTPAVAFRTNLLLPLMNVGIEVPLSNRWSMELDWSSPWVFRQWMNKAYPYYEKCMQVQVAHLEGRIWLGRDHRNSDGLPTHRLLGHSIGFGLGAAHYDLCRDYNGEQGDAAAFGVDYMYSLPVGKGGVHFEVTLGVCGYWNLYHKYRVEQEGITYDESGNPVSAILFSAGNREQRFGVAPFKCGVHLVVPIFHKEVNHE